VAKLGPWEAWWIFGSIWVAMVKFFNYAQLELGMAFVALFTVSFGISPFLKRGHQWGEYLEGGMRWLMGKRIGETLGLLDVLFGESTKSEIVVGQGGFGPKGFGARRFLTPNFFRFNWNFLAFLGNHGIFPNFPGKFSLFPFWVPHTRVWRVFVPL